MRCSFAQCLTTVLCTSLASLMLASGLQRAYADSPRIAAFSLLCFRPTNPDYHTRATLIVRAITANRTIWAVASCSDAPAVADWPTFTSDDGAVWSLDVWITATLEDSSHQTIRETGCATWIGNGYYTGRCIADEQRGGEVNVLVSIAP